MEIGSFQSEICVSGGLPFTKTRRWGNKKTALVPTKGQEPVNSCGTTQFAAKPPLSPRAATRALLVTGRVPVSGYLGASPGSPCPRKTIPSASLCRALSPRGSLKKAFCSGTPLTHRFFCEIWFYYSRLRGKCQDFFLGRTDSFTCKIICVSSLPVLHSFR